MLDRKHYLTQYEDILFGESRGVLAMNSKQLNPYFVPNIVLEFAEPPGIRRRTRWILTGEQSL